MESHLKVIVVVFGVLAVEFLGNNGPALSSAQTTIPATTVLPTTTPAGAITTAAGATTTPAAGVITTTAAGALTTTPAGALTTNPAGAVTTTPAEAITTTPATTTTTTATTTTTTTAAATTTTTAPPSSCTCCTNCTTMETVIASNQRWMSCQKYYKAGGPTTFTVIPDNQGQCMMSGTNCSQCCPQCLFCTQKNGAWLASCVSCPSSATGKPM